MEAGVIIRPVNQTIFEYRIGSRDTLRKRHRITNFAWCLRYGNVYCAQAVAVPGIEHDILENRRIVVLLSLSTTRLAIRFSDVLIEALIELIVRNREPADHDRHDLGFYGHYPCTIQRAAAVLI